MDSAPDSRYPARRTTQSRAFNRAPVAQLDRVLPSEGRGRTFESFRARHKFNGLDRKIQPIFVSTPRRDHSVTKVRPACDWQLALVSPLPLLLSCASRDLIVRDVLDQLLDTTTEVGAELVQHIPRRVVSTMVGKLGEGHPVHSGCRSDLDEHNDPVLPKTSVPLPATTAPDRSALHRPGALPR